VTAPTLTDVSRPRAMGYDFALDDNLFRLAVGPGRQMTIRTAPLEAPRINTTSSAEEAADEFGLIFSRSQFDGGAGLFRAHVEGAAPNRFWDSHGVAVRPAEPGEFPAITLLPSMASVETSTAADLRMAYDELDGSLYLTEGTVLRRTDDPEATTPTWVNDDPAAGDTLTQVHDVAVLGDEVYVAVGANGIHKKDSAGSWAHWNDVAAVRVWAVKGRIIASDGRNLYEVLASGAAPTALITLAPGNVFNDVCDGGSHILAAADDGYVYAYGTDTGSMVLAGQTLFEGESPQALGQTQGIVGVGTAAGNVGRFYTGAVNPESGQLVEQQLIYTWGDTDTAVDQTPYRVVGTRAALWVGVLDEDGRAHLWRYDVITGGITEDVGASAATGVVRGIANVDGKLFFASDAAGVFAQADTYVESGWLMGPLGDFYSSSAKSWIGARLETGDLIGTAVSLYYTTNPDALADPDSSSWVRVTRRESGGGDTGEMQLSNVVARSLAGMVRLHRSADGLSTPAVRSFTYRAYPSSGDEDIIVELPANVSDQIERRGRRRTRIPGRGASAYNTLRGYEGRPVRLRLFKPDMTVLGLVEEVATPIQAITKRGSTTVVSLVRVRGREVSAGVTTGTGPFGTYHLFGETPTFGEMT
jgi:hypothetical protein